MKNVSLLTILLLLFARTAIGQEIRMTETALLEQVYIETFESEKLLPMNDLDMEFGYVLYEAQVTVEGTAPIVQLENVRDYAAIYINGAVKGSVTDKQKKITLDVAPGNYTLQLYAENIGRITYGPEILDNFKGLFGSITLDGEEIEDWEITPLNIKDCEVNALAFSTHTSTTLPCFYKGTFSVESPQATYLDITGWGMGEVWINGKYMGSYWEEEKQQSIQISAADLLTGNNEIIVFELKNNGRTSMKFSETPIFK